MKPDRTDEHGVRHRSSCDLPGWDVTRSAVQGVAVARCQGCGAVRLGIKKTATETRTTT